MKKQLLIIAFVLLFITSCSSKNSQYSEAAYEKQASSNYTTQSFEQTNTRFISKNYSININSKEILKSSNDLKNLVESFKGYIIYSYETFNDLENNHSSYTIRIPSKDINDFNDKLNTVGEITSINLSSDDLTESYNDNSSKLSALKIQEARLIELINKAETIEDLIVIEEKLVNVQSNIEFISNEIKNINTLVDYTTYNIEINSVINTPIKKNFISEIIYSFSDSLSLFILVLQTIIIKIIYLLPYVLVGLIIYFILKKYLKKFIKK